MKKDDIVCIGTGWYRGEMMVIDYVTDRKYKQMVSGTLLNGGGKVNVLAESCYDPSQVVRLKHRQSGRTAALEVAMRVLQNRPPTLK